MTIIDNDEDRLRALAAFLPLVAADDFFPGETVFPADTSDGVSRLPYTDQSTTVSNFFQMVHERNWVVPFEWTHWVSSQEAKDLFAEEGIAVSKASADQLSKMLTTCVRRDRFREGSFVADFESGLMTRILRRADALLQMRN